MEVEKFEGTHSRLGGILTLALAVLVAGYGLVELDRGFPPWGIAAAAVFGVLAWAAMVRPALWAEGHTLVLRNMFETVHVPMAAIRAHTLRQVLTLQVGERRYSSPVVGRALGKAARSSRFVDTSQTTLASMAVESEAARSSHIDHGDFIEERLQVLFDGARQIAGVRKGSAEQQALADGVRRELAWLPIGLAVAAALALVLTILL